jgi:hypothetical protein
MSIYDETLLNGPQLALSMNIQAIDDSLNYMPDCAYKAYVKWILKNPDIRDEWLQLVGIQGLIRLTERLLGELLTDTEYEQVLPYSVPVNISQMYEVVSDNLAIRLASPTDDSASYNRRSRLLRLFNDVVVQCLNGSSESPEQLLQPLIPLMCDTSLFVQSLNANKHRDIAWLFLQNQPYINLDQIEYALYPNLLANVETCLELVNTIRGYRSEELVVDGLIRRYQGVNYLLEHKHIPPKKLLEVGMDTIMVVPTLAYYVGILAEEIRPVRNYPAIVENGLLLSALEDAALLVRLLNDVGTCLLEQSDAEHEALKYALWNAQESECFSSFDDLLVQATEEYPATFTRLRKDIMYREFNLCLHEVSQASSVAGAIDTFHQQLVYLSEIYRAHQHRLSITLDQITDYTESTLIVDLLTRFVGFHQMIYSQPFSEPTGEYAV